MLDMLPGDVGVTPRDTARRAGGVEQNRVKLPAVPPGVDIRGVGVPDRRFKSEALQVLVDRFSAGRADFHCREFDISEFQHVGRLAARRRAGVEHNLPVLRVERLNRQLAAGILHRDHAFGETRDLADRERFLQRDGVHAGAIGFDSGLLQFGDIGVRVRLSGIHAERQGSL